MTALDPEITITGLRGRVAELIDTRDRLTRERDDERDEVVELCQERLQLRQALAEARAEAARHLEHLRTAHPAHFTANVLGERMCGCGGQWPCPVERDQLEQARAAIDRVREYVGGDLALTNVEMADLKHLPHDAHHEDCGAVWQGYFLRMVRAALDGSGT